MRRLLAVTACLLVLVAGYATLDAFDRVPGILTLAPAGAAVPTGMSSPRTSGSPTTPTAVPTPPDSAVDALATPADGAPVPTGAGLRRELARRLVDRRLGGSVGVTIRDAATGAHLLDVAADTPRTPASTAKLLTAAAVTSTLEPTGRLTTRAVQGATAQDVVLVAGGDTLLSPGRGDPTAVAGHAGLADLATQVATALQARGTHDIRVRVDDSYLAGSLYAPGWAGTDVAEGLTGPVAMIGLSTQRPRPGHPAATDPALSAAQAFARALAANGLSVDPRPTRGRAGSTAAVLGEVESAPVGDVLAQALDDSDNALTESLARQAAARAGRPTGYPDVAAWVLATLRSLGIDTTGVHLVDSSGLSSGTRVPARVIGDVLARAAGGRDPALQAVVARLPVAALTGTLHDRFTGSSAHAAAGIARAKTGTLTGVSSLAGTLVDRDGRLLLYAILADQVPHGVGTLYARAALDAFVATLVTCGCR